MAIAGWQSDIYLLYETALADFPVSQTGMPVKLVIGTGSGTTNANTTTVFADLGENYKKLAVELNDSGVSLDVYMSLWDTANNYAELWVKIDPSSTVVQKLKLYWEADHEDNLQVAKKGEVYNGSLAGYNDSVGETRWIDKLNRVVIPGTALAGDFPAGAGTLTVDFQTLGLTTWIGSVWIGEQAPSGNAYDFDGNQVQLFFSGSPSKISTSTSNVILRTDPISTFGIDTAKNYVIAFSSLLHTDTKQRRATSLDGALNWSSGYGVEESGDTIPALAYVSDNLIFLLESVDVVAGYLDVWSQYSTVWDFNEELSVGDCSLAPVKGGYPDQVNYGFFRNCDGVTRFDPKVGRYIRTDAASLSYIDGILPGWTSSGDDLHALEICTRCADGTIVGRPFSSDNILTEPYSWTYVHYSYIYPTYFHGWVRRSIDGRTDNESVACDGTDWVTVGSYTNTAITDGFGVVNCTTGVDDPHVLDYTGGIACNGGIIGASYTRLAPYTTEVSFFRKIEVMKDSTWRMAMAKSDIDNLLIVSQVGGDIPPIVCAMGSLTLSPALSNIAVLFQTVFSNTIPLASLTNSLNVESINVLKSQVTSPLNFIEGFTACPNILAAPGGRVADIASLNSDANVIGISCGIDGVVANLHPLILDISTSIEVSPGGVFINVQGYPFGSSWDNLEVNPGEARVNIPPININGAVAACFTGKGQVTIPLSFAETGAILENAILRSAVAIVLEKLQLGGNYVELNVSVSGVIVNLKGVDLNIGVAALLGSLKATEGVFKFSLADIELNFSPGEMETLFQENKIINDFCYPSLSLKYIREKLGTSSQKRKTLTMFSAAEIRTAFEAKGIARNFVADKSNVTSTREAIDGQIH